MKVINTENIIEKTKAVFLILSAITLGSLLILYSDECKEGISYGLTLCASTLVPSLFLYMILASYISISRISDYVSKLFKSVTKRFFRIDENCGAAIFMSLFGGYPVGAQCIAQAYKCGKISKATAKKCSLYAVSSGPSFILNFVAGILYNDIKSGIILFVSSILSFFTTAFFISVFIKSDNDETSVIKEKDNSSGFIQAVQNSCSSIINMCAMVVVFSGITRICEKIFENNIIYDVLVILLEVTTACCKLSDKYPLYIISFSLGFCGVCIHLQIFSILKDIEINKALFFLFRIIQGISSAIFTYILLIFFPVSTEVFSNVSEPTLQFSHSAVGGIMLMLTAVCFLNSINISNFKRRY